MSHFKCPECKSTHINQYRTIVGKMWCNDCDFKVDQKELPGNPFLPQLPEEIRTEVKVYRVEKPCACGKGVLEATGLTQPMNPPNYFHECTACNHGEWVRGGKRYPIIEYGEV